MKRFSLILLAALVISALSFSSVLAKSPENTSSGAPATPTTNTLGVCGWGDLEGQTIHGKLYAPPGFNLKEFMRMHPEFSWQRLNELNRTVVVGAIPGTGLANGSLVGCNIIVLPSA